MVAYGHALGGLPQTGAACNTAGLDCAISSLRAGVQAFYIAPWPHLESWLGVSFGIERLAFAGEGAAAAPRLAP